MRSGSLLTKSMVWIVGSIVIVFLVASFFQWRQLKEHTMRNLRSDSSSLASVVAVGMHNNMLKADQEGAQALLLRMGQLEGVRRAYIVNPEAKVAFSSEVDLIGKPFSQEDVKRLISGEKELFELRQDKKGERFTNVLAPIPMEAACIQCHSETKIGEPLGFLGIERWADKEFQELSAMERTMLLTSLCIVLCVATAIYFLLRGVVGRLNTVSQVADQVAHGNINQVIAFQSNDELGRLAD